MVLALCRCRMALPLHCGVRLGWSLNSIMTLFSPLEQFALVNLGLITNSMLFGSLAILAWVLLVAMGSGSSTAVVPSRWMMVVGSIYSLMVSMIHQTLGSSVEHTRNFFVYVFSLFTLILFLNMSGLIPYTFTVTSHLIVTLVLSLSMWIGKGVILFQNHGLKSFSLVYPAGIAMGLALPLVLIETLGFVITIVSLSVRLFANMMAGHILLKVLAGFAWTMAFGSTVVFLGHVFPLMVVYVMMFMETGIAFVQAYVFALLTCIYLGDAIQGGH